MDWSNERYVRVYTRNTDDWITWCWQARTVLLAAFRSADRSGVIEARRGAKSLAALLLLPVEVVEAGLPDLLEGGADGGAPMIETERGYLIRNFTEAQDATKSDKQRAKESRERRRDDFTKRDGDVTKRDARVANRDEASREIERVGQNVTLTSADPDPGSDLSADRGVTPPARAKRSNQTETASAPIARVVEGAVRRAPIAADDRCRPGDGARALAAIGEP